MGNLDHEALLHAGAKGSMEKRQALIDRVGVKMSVDNPEQILDKLINDSLDYVERMEKVGSPILFLGKYKKQALTALDTYYKAQASKDMGGKPEQIEDSLKIDSLFQHILKTAPQSQRGLMTFELAKFIHANYVTKAQAERDIAEVIGDAPVGHIPDEQCCDQCDLRQEQRKTAASKSYGIGG